MGYLKERRGMRICPECAMAHDPKLPHNRASIAYQNYFYDKNGRQPTWKDAMSHCTDAVKEKWTRELREWGVEV